MCAMCSSPVCASRCVQRWRATETKRLEQPSSNQAHCTANTATPTHLQVEMFTELIGTMIFALLGGVADPNGTGRDGCAPALVLTVWARMDELD